MEEIEKAVQEKDVTALCYGLFGADLRDKKGQQEIVRTIAFTEHPRVTITAFTRYGKTYSVALGAALYLFLHEGRTINEIAPTQRQAKKFRQYLIDFILECPPLKQQLDVNASGVERIRKEVSKKRVTFKDGNEVNILTAGGSNTAESLMGHGGDLIILDESCDISAEVYRKRVSRQLGDNADSVLVEIGNPWRKDNHFYKHWQSDRFKRIRVDWRQGLEEGRISESFVDEQRRELTGNEFQVLYDAEFPDSVEQGVFKHSWVEAAIEREPFVFEADEKVVGLDVAEKGRDKTVMCSTFQEGNRVNVSGFEFWRNVETMQSVAKVDGFLKGYEQLYVDAIGVGSGVADRLREKDFYVVPVKVSRSPSAGKDRYLNRKAQFYWKLRGLFEEGRISLPESVPDVLVEQLTSLRYEINSGGKIKVVDPEDGSPDFADALMLACCGVSALSGGGETARVGVV